MQPSAPPAYDVVTGEGKQYEYYQGQPIPPPGQQQPPYYAAGQPYSQPYITESTPLQSSYQPTPEPFNASREEGFTTSAAFDDKNVRRVFIRKVYLILAIQLIITFGIITVFTLVKPIHGFLRANPALYFVSYAIFFVLYIVLVCFDSIRRRSPLNIILLMLFTLAFSYMLGTIASFYKTQSVMVALGITVGVCFAVTLFSMQTRFDFTQCGGVLFVLSMVLFFFGLITIFTYHYNWYLNVVYGSLAALLFTLFLAFDTQLIMGGKHHELSPEEHIFAALTLYIDIVYIFIYMLMIFGERR